MSSKLGLERTIGTVYGELMRESGISLPNGRYISGTNFASGLVDAIAIPEVKIQKILRSLSDSVDYGDNDNIYTGVQFLKYVFGLERDGIRQHWSSTYIFNPWRELILGDELGKDLFIPDRNGIFAMMRSNPRKGVEGIRDMYALFIELPISLQEDFLGIVESFPCYLGGIMDRYIDKSLLTEERISEINELFLKTY